MPAPRSRPGIGDPARTLPLEPLDEAASTSPGAAITSPTGTRTASRRGPARVTFRWRPLARGLWVAAAATLGLSGSLPRLWDVTEAQSPISYRLTAALAGGLALLARARRPPGEPAIHDRQVDYLVGLPLLALAAAELSVPPARFDDRYWNAHADLLALPLLAAGAITLVFGTRALWRQRVTLTVWLLVLAPLTSGAVRRLSDWLAWPALALARTSGSWLGGWDVVASPPGHPGRLGGDGLPGTVLRVADGPGGTVAFDGATHGLVGGLGALAVIVLVAATAASWRGAARRALSAAAVCVVTILGRIGVAVVAGRAGGPASARTVLGDGGDLVTFGLIVATLGGLGLAAGARHAARGGERGTARGGARPAAGRPPVARAYPALLLVALVCGGLAALDIPGNRNLDQWRPTLDAARPDPRPAGEAPR
ncbi:Exosortase/archaeosortase family protein [Frankia sp. AgKG'84/4]